MPRIYLFLALVTTGTTLLAQEICNNGIDDDGNGLIDLNDAACDCPALLNETNAPSYLPNHAFEQLDAVSNCCPVSFGQGVGGYDPFWCLSGWNQTSYGSSDFMHPCGFYPAVLPAPPDGGGYIGFISSPGYQEYVGRCIPGNTLQQGITYTLSFWVHGTSLGVRHPGAIVETRGAYYTEALPLTIYARPNCLWTATPTIGCLAEADPDSPGHIPWTVLGSMPYHPTGAWQHVSMTLTPPFDVERIAIGGGCDVPAGFAPRSEVINGDTVRFSPYFLVDELLLNTASTFITLPVTAEGDACAEDLLLTAAPPTGSSEHQWYHNGVAIVGATDLQLDASSFGAGTYSFTCNTGGACLMGWTTAPGPGPLMAPVIGPHEGCVPLTVQFTQAGYPSGSTINWWFGDGGTAVGETVEHTYAMPGIHDVRVVVNTPQGCVLDSTFIAAVVAHPLPHVTFHAYPQQVPVGRTEVALEDLTEGAIAVRHWDLDTIPPYTHGDQEITITLPDVPGSYPVTLTITDDHGCSNSASTVLVVIDDAPPELPNVFSPNGDGQNDRFVPLNGWSGPGELLIRNRWGQLLFSCSPPQLGWDGRVNGERAPEGTYFYELVRPAGSAPGRVVGHFQLLR